MLQRHSPHIRHDSLFLLEAELDDEEVKTKRGRHNIKEDGRGCKKCRTSVTLTSPQRKAPAGVSGSSWLRLHKAAPLVE
ncbi:hypothetical protein EYF80_060444 [Liparis tanakae]|uniref:Uncharacterized protein n=1 Tax=Liparis tanakae TaxID=230148 RepID=A0A4Z2EKE1_9TELE|nr:hypothetical protein EYF80_060444 [Liparis tanakae]